MPSSGRCRAAARNFCDLLAELRDRQRAAAVLQQEVEARGRAEPGQRRDVEREDDRLRDRRELRSQPAHDAVDVQRLGLALLPRLQAHEDRAVVRLVGAGHRAVAADGLEGVEPVGLGQDVLDLLQHEAGALERGPGRKLDVDAEDALVLVRDEAGRQHAREQAGPDRHRGDDPDRQQRPAHEQARHAHVALGGDVEHLVEAAEEGPQRAAHRLRRLEQHGAQRRRERQRVEGRQQHRDGDRQRELLVHAADQPAEEGDRDEHGREDERDADDRRRDLLHRLDRRLLRSSSRARGGG